MDSNTPAVSDLLKNARKAQGLTVKAVAQEICVQSTYLKAIENGEYDLLPAQTFAVGFVRSYATALGENADEIVAAFKDECGLPKSPKLMTPASKAVEHPKARKKVPGWLSPLAGLVGASLCWMVLGGSLTGTAMVADAENEIANEKAQLAALQSNLSVEPPEATSASQAISTEPVAVTEVEVREPVTTAPASRSLFIPAAHADAVPTASSLNGVVLEAFEDTWVRLARTDGTEVWSGILRAGQSYRPSEAGQILLSTSNAGGLSLKQGSADIVQLGARGEIVTDFALEANTHFSEGVSVSTAGVGSR